MEQQVVFMDHKFCSRSLFVFSLDCKKKLVILVNMFCFFSFLFFFIQECDQVHIDDVASDDNGQDLR